MKILPNKNITHDKFEKELEKIPPLPEYIRNLKGLKCLDLSNHSLKEIEQLYFSNAIVFPGYSVVIPSNLLNAIRLYRVRKNIDFKREDLNSISTYSYPPQSVLNENGRANLKNKSVFYCGHTYFTALKEAKLKRGDTGYLTVWNIAADRNCEYGAFLPDNLPDNNPWRNFNSMLDVQRFNAANGLSKSKQLEYLHGFIAELFMEEKPPYSLTSWLADKMLLGYQFIDFIVYPSFEAKSSKCNLVFKPEFVDRYLNFERVYIFKTREVTESNVEFEIKIVGETNSHQIIWRNPSEEDHQFLERK